MRTNPVLTPSKVRYISHLGHTPNTAEPLAFKQGAVQFCAPQRGCSDGIIPPLICTQPNPFVRVKITLSSEHFKEENDSPFLPSIRTNSIPALQSHPVQ